MRRIAGWLAAIVALYGWSTADAQTIEAEVIEVQTDAGAAPQVRVFAGPRGGLIATARVNGEAPFAIGVSLDELPEVVKSQLKLERGLVVTHVLEKSPAEAAGVKKNDLILSAGGADVKTPADVVAAVAKAETNPLALVLLREGKEVKVEVKPDAKAKVNSVVIPGGGDLALLAKAFEQALPAGAPPAIVEGGNVIRLHPGVIHSRMKLDALPAGVKVTITKEGDQPAKVTIEKGEQKWEGAEDKLDEAPEELRAIGKQALGREARIELGVQAPHVKWMNAPAGVPSAPPVQAERIQAEVRRKIAEAEEKAARAAVELKKAEGVRRAEIRKVESVAEGKLEAKLDEVLKRLEGAEQMKKQLNELREQFESLKKELK